MTKEEIKNKLDELIIELNLTLEEETEDANVFIDCNDWWDLIRKCSKARIIYEEINDLEWTYGETFKELTSVIDYYQDQIDEFKKACEEAKKEE